MHMSLEVEGVTEPPRQPGEPPAVVIVPCAGSGRAGCQIVRRAVELVAAGTPEAALSTAEGCPAGGQWFIVAVDGSSACRASAALEARGIRPAAVISAPEVLGREGLVRPGVDVRGSIDELSVALAEAIRESLREVLEEVRERRRYREEMAPILERFRDLWGSVETLGPPPDGVPAEQERRRVELLGSAVGTCSRSAMRSRLPASGRSRTICSRTRCCASLTPVRGGPRVTPTAGVRIWRRRECRYGRCCAGWSERE